MAARKKHWTQTREGKRKLKERSERLRHAKQHQEGTHDAITPEDHATQVAFTHCDTWISLYADTWGLPRSILARRVGELLQGTSGR